MQGKAKVSDSPVKGSRILAFDLLRGYFMLSIILVHLQWYPSGYDVIAMRGTLNVSAAEGFFFLSGLVLGIVRGRKLLGKPFAAVAALMLKRGLTFYAISIILTLVFTMIGWFFIHNVGLKPGIMQPGDLLGSLGAVFSLQYNYGWADYLRFFAIFMIISPLVLWITRKGFWYVALLASFGVWLLYPWAAGRGIADAGSLMVLSWQFIFFGGFMVGFYWEKLTALWRSLPVVARKTILYTTIALALITLAANVAIEAAKALHVLPAELLKLHESISDKYFNKERLSFARIILFLLWFTLGFFVCKRFERVIIKYAGWLLLPFGQNSLYVYILHAIVIFFVHLVIPPGVPSNILINFVATTAVLAIIYLAIRKEFLFKIIPR